MDQVAPNTPPAIPPTPKPSILPVVLSFFLCISLAGVGLLAYQNMVLQRQIVSLQVQPIPTLSPASTPTADPTANWKTYTNGNYNYQFKYPLNWPDIPSVVSNQKDGFQLAGQNVYLSQYFPQVKPPQFQIEVFKSNKELRPDELEEKEGCGFPTFAISKSKVGGIQAIVGRRLAPRDSSAPYYTGLHYCVRTYSGGFIYNFLWEEGSDVDSGLFDQILSTFKFVDTLQEKTNGSFCGGFVGVICPDGYNCKYDDNYPDASGVCVKN